jgi:glycerol-3-phosphate dehydrogenase
VNSHGRTAAPAPSAPFAGERYDVVVIGAGVLGCAIAAELAISGAAVCVLEKSGDVAEGASKGNAGITSSYYAPPGTLECELVAESNGLWEELCARLGVPYRRIGALTVAFDREGEQALDELEEQVRAAGTKVDRLTGEQARMHEPLLSDQCTSALYYPDEGIVDPMRLTWAYAEIAARNGAVFAFDKPVIDFERSADELTAAVTPHGRVHGRFFVNAAGLGSGEISAAAGGDEIRMWPRKGQYWILDREFGQRMSRIVLPVPTPTTRGIEVAPTTNGSVLLGPDAVDGTDVTDTGTDAAGLADIVAKTQRLIPSLSVEFVIKSYAANRPAADEPVRLRVDGTVRNLVHAGNRSTGVSTSPAFATRVARLLEEHGLELRPRPAAVTGLPPIHRLLLDATPEQHAPADVTDQTVVCVCEQVTAAEITAAVTCAVPARSIEGVRKRTRATGGRCQGSICMAGVVLLTSTLGGVPPGEVGMGSRGGSVGVG